jgi:hypothetical protein
MRSISACAQSITQQTPHLSGNRGQLNFSDVEIYQRSIGVLTSPRWFRCQLFFQNIGGSSMRTFIRCATLAFALVAGVPVASAQSPVTQQPYEAFIVQPSGTLVTQMPFVALPEGVIPPVQTVQTSQSEHAAPPVQTVRTIQPEHVAQPIARHQTVVSHQVIVHHVTTAVSEHVAQPIARHRIVASRQVIVHHVAAAASSQPLYDYVALVPVVRRIITPVVIAPAPARARASAQCIGSVSVCRRMRRRPAGYGVCHAKCMGPQPRQ